MWLAGRLVNRLGEVDELVNKPVEFMFYGCLMVSKLVK